MRTRVVVGRARVVGEVRAAGPLMAELRSPVTARAPWLTAVLHAGPRAGRPVAIVVESQPGGRQEAVAFLTVRRRGLATRVTMLGDGVGPAPGGVPSARLLARDERAAERLAAGICDLLGSLRGPRRLALAGLPLGDPTARALAARLPDGLIANARRTAIVDGLDGLDGPGDVVRSRDPRDLERRLPAVLTREPDRRRRDFLRAAARVHAAIGQVELAVLPGAEEPRAALLTLVDGSDRRPWWGWTDVGGLDAGMGAPVVALTDPARRWP